jgi:thymidylate synthase (FAD)
MVRLLAHTPDPERLIAAAAKNCYSAAGGAALLDNMDGAEVSRFLDMLMSLGHESVLEHASFSFAADGVSRSLLAQITRHRIATFSVKSQRYVKEGGFEPVMPGTISDSAEARGIFEGAMRCAEEAYRALSALGIPKEDARFVLPNACSTNIVFTMNARELRHFFRLRCCNRSQWEIRELAIGMLGLVREAAPAIFQNAGPACLRGGCPEGKMTCGQAQKVRERFSGL